ncbi:TonB-dependent receptor [Dyella sp. LX-66]|uniref:TonB-dependent receptor plug domain-containing protein n=1 Tax=unclassified Dyella TaxID=2634549 RepID=UPI001BDFF91E|nr:MULTISPECIES: TonB-dependent receptor [unclassified Dyella]MBT2115535.1 TonB-dependent receptor [Dyella sp. LX-1]MBT2139350.1 TonB-dependent receptor [Dyella sp. LX-66]
MHQRYSTLASALLLALSAGAAAQDATPAAGTDKAKNLSTVIVTGTRADNRTESSSLTPIDVVSAKVLQQTGTTELSTALSRIIPSLTFPRPAAADTADSQRPAQLRGLSPDQVLVLVNGKRWHPGAILLTNGVLGRGSQAVDLNTIPMAAIDHIEVLRDGASAQYGSDAIAGVINIVLKGGADGGAVELSGGQYSAGDGRQWKGSASFGLPLNHDQGWLRFTLQDGHQDYSNRAGPNRTRAWEGTTQRYGDPEVGDHNLFLNGQYKLGESAELYTFGHIGKRDSTSPAFFRNLANSNSVPSLYPNGYLPLENADSLDQSLVLGVRGKTAGGWRWDVSANYGGNRVSYATNNSVNRAFLHDFGSSPTSFHDGILSASQQAFDVDLAKEFSTSWLPNPVTLAFGAEYLRQTYKIDAGDLASYYTGTSGTSGGAQGFGGFQPANAGSHARHDVAEYVSLETNLTDKLGASLAGRHEHYSDFGNTTSGALALRYDFTDRFALRGSASTGFRAPSLAQQNYSYVSSLFFGAGNSLGLPQGIYNTGIVPATSKVATLLGGEPLKPEKSRNLTVGAVWNPIDPLNLSIDVYQIKIDNRIVLSSNLATNSATVHNYLVANGVADLNYSGIAYFTNALNTRTRGVDLVGSYLFDFGNAGTLQATLSYNYNKNKVTDLKANPAALNALGLNLKRIDRRDQYGLLADTTPRSKLILSGLYSVDRWSLRGALTRYGSFISYNSTTATLDQKFDSKWLLDLAVNYNLDRWTFTLGADNVFNTYPDRVIPANDNSGTLPYSVFSPFGFNGAYVYGKLAYRW